MSGDGWADRTRAHNESEVAPVVGGNPYNPMLAFTPEERELLRLNGGKFRRTDGEWIMVHSVCHWDGDRPGKQVGEL